MALGSACWRAWDTADMEGCWLRGEGITRPGDRLVEARVLLHRADRLSLR